MSKKKYGVKLMKGSDLVEYISTRQAKQVRRLNQAYRIYPKLVIINSNTENLASAKYTELKRRRGEELGIEVEEVNPKEQDLGAAIKELNEDSSVHGIILQLPLADRSKEEELASLIDPKKDVDGMGKDSLIVPATAKAIEWLLAGFGVELKNKKITIIGKGKLVGAPLLELWKSQGLDVRSFDEKNSEQEIKSSLKGADVIVSAAGKAGLIKLEDLKNGQVVVDAGTSESGGKLVGDVDKGVYKSELDIKISARVGGVGPLTISCLYENMLELIDKNIL